MDRIEILNRILGAGITAVIRAQSSEHLMKIAEALKAGGVESIEVTMTTPNALQVISEVAARFGDEILLGVGTCLDPETARAAILAGAQFAVSPTLNLETIKMVHRYDKVILPGCFTPTEILTAWENGADLVKVFPADVVGPVYFKDVLAPLPQVRLVPTGGVDLTTAADFLKAGAAALCVGGAMMPKAAMAAGDWPAITAIAAQFVQIVKDTRAAM
ncbi:MAG TPA: bifunctional 4-hydroxy-2-oxoglutarate aldolase/2-dehydro-3-deoxy-phosphogluconate aldolase [Armatimonadota bacterium]|jgi:2-dehydro-3-deoxyphosphogluconate aldolase/(4S)-4-hydroxy-2-oxoglutarate aldolase